MKKILSMHITNVIVAVLDAISKNADLSHMIVLNPYIYFAQSDWATIIMDGAIGRINIIEATNVKLSKDQSLYDMAKPRIDRIKNIQSGLAVGNARANRLLVNLLLLYYGAVLEGVNLAVETRQSLTPDDFEHHRLESIIMDAIINIGEDLLEWYGEEEGLIMINSDLNNIYGVQGFEHDDARENSLLTNFYTEMIIDPIKNISWKTRYISISDYWDNIGTLRFQNPKPFPPRSLYEYIGYTAGSSV